jgi:hypothetical protein
MTEGLVGGSWQDWLFVVGYVSILGFVIFMVLRPRNPE